MKGVVKFDTVNLTLTFTAFLKSSLLAITQASSPAQPLMMFVRTSLLSITVLPAFLIAMSTVSSTSSDVPGATGSAGSEGSTGSAGSTGVGSSAMGSTTPSLLRTSILATSISSSPHHSESVNDIHSSSAWKAGVSSNLVIDFVAASNWKSCSSLSQPLHQDF